MKAKLIVGLGNPGERYATTLHNAGFLVIDYLAQYGNWPKPRFKFEGYFWTIKTAEQTAYFVKPYTYMNLSGDCVSAFQRYFKITNSDTIIIFDDKDMLFGKMRMRHRGTSGGHNGIKSIIHNTKSDDFKRIKIGIGDPNSPLNTIDYVLSSFQPNQLAYLKKECEVIRKVLLFYLFEANSWNKTITYFNNLMQALKKEPFASKTN